MRDISATLILLTGAIACSGSGTTLSSGDGGGGDGSLRDGATLHDAGIEDPVGLFRPKKKIVQLGWDTPTAAYVSQRVAAMEQAPFDGIVVYPGKVIDNNYHSAAIRSVSRRRGL